jgi:hypothetical protein
MRGSAHPKASCLWKRNKHAKGSQQTTMPEWNSGGLTHLIPQTARPVWTCLLDWSRAYTLTTPVLLEVYPRVFLNWEFGGGDKSGSLPGLLTAGKRFSVSIGEETGWASDGLEAVEEIKPHASIWKQNHSIIAILTELSRFHLRINFNGCDGIYFYIVWRRFCQMCPSPYSAYRHVVKPLQD